MNKKICVFCSSRNAIDESYFTLAKNLAEKISEEKDILLYGGANVGMMGEIAKTAKNNNIKIIGVIPKKIKEKNLHFKLVDQLIVTKSMHERKSKLEELADAFIALPGGFGTLEELSEIITLKQLEYHSLPIVILNYNNFYDNLIKFFDVMYNQNFSKHDYKKIYYVTNSIDEAYEYIKNYKYTDLGTKWFDKS